jgi:membrane protease subunit HflC
MRFVLRLVFGIFIVGFLIFGSTVVTVPQGYKAVVTHFGRPDRILNEPGAHAKWPWPIDSTYLFDTRSRVYNTRFTQTLTQDKKSIILLTYIVWNIDRPLVFLQAVGTTENAENKIEGLVSSAKNNVLGNYDLNMIVSTDPEMLKISEIEHKILESVQVQAREKFGVNISQLGIKRLAFPENNVLAIFDQMKAERAQYAAKYRAEGSMDASIIRSDAKLEVSKINALAVRESAEIRGRADRKSAEIYAQAHKQGKEFYKFEKSLETLEKIVDRNAVLIVRADQPPFNLLYEQGSTEDKQGSTEDKQSSTEDKQSSTEDEQSSTEDEQSENIDK